MARLLTLVFLLACAATAAGPPAVKTLLIANGAYRSLPALPSAGSNTNRVAQALRPSESRMLASDLDASALNATIDRYIEALHEGDTALVFFSGHTAADQGDFYLLPVDFIPSQSSGIAARAYSVSRLLAQLDQRGIRRPILILDTATAGPAPAAPPEFTKRTQVLVSSQPGEFIEALTATLRDPSIALYDLVRQTRMAASKLSRQGPFVNSADGLRYLWIPAGAFQMGCTAAQDAGCQADEQPRHAVRLSHGFWIGASEVTAAAYARFAKAAGAPMPAPAKTNPNWRDATQPIMRVSWADAGRYCQWAGGRLPTEAEWEYAARGGLDASVYPWAGDLSRSKANYRGAEGADRWEDTAPVQSFPPNPFGLYDMAGNLWEWCFDFYDPAYYTRSPDDDPQGPAAGDGHVIRGGSWNSPPRYLRVALRDRDSSAGNHIGFRCVFTAPPPSPAPQ